MNPKVTVRIPVFNREQFDDEAIRSVVELPRNLVAKGRPMAVAVVIAELCVLASRSLDVYKMLQWREAAQASFTNTAERRETEASAGRTEFMRNV